jgi:peroxiredoxin
MLATRSWIHSTAWLDLPRLLGQRSFRESVMPVPPRAWSRTTPTLVQAEFEASMLDVVSGRSVRLSACLGQRPFVVALTRIFSQNLYCPICFPHILELNQRYGEFQKRGVEVFLVTSTDVGQSRVVAKDLGLQMPLLSHPSGNLYRTCRAGQALGAPLPVQLVYDVKGRLRYHHLFSFLDPNASVDRLLTVLD